MRIGTWNLDGRWGSRHADLLASLACDILLLTEVSPAVEIPGFAIHATCGAMARGQRWAAVAARDSLLPLPDPHVGTAMAQVGELRVCSSILPWRDLRWTRSWPGTNQAQKTSAAVAAIEGARPTVWGGDWNHIRHRPRRHSTGPPRHHHRSPETRPGLGGQGLANTVRIHADNRPRSDSGLLASPGRRSNLGTSQCDAALRSRCVRRRHPRDTRGRRPATGIARALSRVTQASRTRTLSATDLVGSLGRPDATRLRLRRHRFPHRE